MINDNNINDDDDNNNNNNNNNNNLEAKIYNFADFVHSVGIATFQQVSFFRDLNKKNKPNNKNNNNNSRSSKNSSYINSH